MSGFFNSPQINALKVVSELEEKVLCGEELPAELYSVELADPASVDATIDVIERLQVQSEFFRGRAAQLMDVAKKLATAQERIQRTVKDLMATNGVQDLNGHAWRYRLSRAKPKLVIDDGLLPAEFTKEKVSVVPDKLKIEQALERGEEVAGAQYEQSYSLRTYPAKEIA